MRPLVALLGVVLATIAVSGLAWWLERASRRPGLFFLVAAVVLCALATLRTARRHDGRPG